MAKWSATASNLPSYGERVISSVKWKAVISEIYDYLHTVRTASYGTVEPTAENGELWYDTNVGQNKLKVKTATGWEEISSTLPTASDSVLGGIKVGTNLSITDGVLSADDQSYTLPTASDSVLGGVKVGNTLTIDSSGVLSAYALNIAGQKIEPSTTPTANKIPVADEDGKIDDGWIDAKTTPTVNKIPVADEDGKIDDGWIPATVARTASPTLTGTPTAPTAAAGTNTTQIATTAFVNSEITNDRPYATATPLMDGTAAVGSSAKVAMEDHVHPSDTAKLSLSGGTMTGVLYPQNNTSYTTGQARRIILSTGNPSGGGNGDVWIKYV